MTMRALYRTIMDMSHIGASLLKAKLGKYLRAVRSGRAFVTTDRDEPVAELIPHRASPHSQKSLPISQPRDPGAPALGVLHVRGIKRTDINTTELLRQDRDRR